jgi:hypothetical protein
MKPMKKILAALLLTLPVMASADTLDVIEFKLKEGCDFATYMAIVKDFNASWGEAYGYKAEILMPLHRANLETMYWVGRATSAEAFGDGWDAWRDAQSDPASVPAKLWARMDACSLNLNRAAYDTYQ